MDYKITYYLNHLGAGTWVDSASFFVSWIPFLIAFWLILALISLIFDRQNGKWLFFGTILVLIIHFVLTDIIIKPGLANFFFRERPYITFPEAIISSGEIWDDSSFFSGHMAIISGFLTLYLYFYRKWLVWIPALLVWAIIAFSRLHNGMHYPTDILAGTIFGIGYGLLAIKITKKLKSRSN